ncbi:MAG: HAMP domain-containing protein [Deltaproteobacteria bacterium]|nr:HAMP domain-containing protein [Deltaproteobacteria bacterium]
MGTSKNYPSLFGKVRIGTRLSLGFLSLACLIAAVSFIAYNGWNKIQIPLIHGIPAGLRQIEKNSLLDALAQKIRSHDETLTNATRKFLETEDRRWKDQYLQTSASMKSALLEALERGDDKEKEIFGELQRTRQILAVYEERAIDLLESGQKEGAAVALEEAVYWNSKGQFREDFERYLELRGKKLGGDLVVTSKEVEKVVRELRPLKILEEGTRKIGKGQLGHRISVGSEDEIGELAQTFNKMAEELKDSYAGLEEKVREKTRDLEIAKNKIEREKIEQETLLASIGDGMLTTDQSGKIVMMNDLAKSLLGYEPGEYQGAFFDLLVSPEDEKGKPLSPDQRPVAAALARRKSVMRRAHFYRKDERKLPVSVTASPVLMNGEIIGTIETFRDITKEMELDQMKDEFVSVTSHELRTPLTVIREGVSLVLDGLLGAVTDRQKKFLSVTLKDIDRLKRIIDDLLDVSKIEAGKVQLKKEKVDLISLAKGVADSFQSRAQSKGLEIKTEFFTQSLEMELDQDKIIQVFTNLIGNAFKFTEKGHVEISVRENGNFAECGVTDTGPGMSPDGTSQRSESGRHEFSKGGDDPILLPVQIPGRIGKAF